jgi:hypothetical protein
MNPAGNRLSPAFFIFECHIGDLSGGFIHTISSRQVDCLKNFYVNGKAYGGFIGNAKGLSAYLQSYLTNHIFSKEETKRHLFTEQKSNMSYSWFTGVLNGNRYVTHAGGGGGYYCEIRIYPELNLASAFLRNRSSFSDLRFLEIVDARFLSSRF